MEKIIEIRIRSQILYMTSLKISPKWSSETNKFHLPEQQLPLTINEIESKLGNFPQKKSLSMVLLNFLI